MSRESASSRQRGPRWFRRFRRTKFIRILRKDRAFAALFAVGVAACLAVAISVPKIWRVTPEGFARGTVKVSLVDIAQAASLARSARRAAAAGDFEAALFAWRGALANNVADPRLHRGVLELLRTQSSPHPDQAVVALFSAAWLSTLVPGDAGDAVGIADVLERFGQPLVALETLSTFAEGTDDAVDRARARCLAATGRWFPFEALWRARGAAWAGDARMALYVDAWRAASDSRSSGLEATLRLREVLMNAGGEAELTAARLLLLVASQHGQLDNAVQALDCLERRGAASAAHHARVWLALARAGRASEAWERAGAYQRAPRDPTTAAEFVRALDALELSDQAIRFVEENLRFYGPEPSVWGAYFDVLARTGKWKELRRAAANARVASSRQEPLYAEAVFSEYRAALGEDRTAEAGRLAIEIAQASIVHRDTCLRAAPVLRRAGHTEAALQLLHAQEARLRDVPAYWSEVFAAALGVKDIEGVRRAVAEAARLEPGNPAWTNNRAALLLITGEDPAEALQLTFQGLSRLPNSAPLAINHALALVANGRMDDAARLLATLAPDQLDAASAANFHFAAAQIAAGQGRLAEATEAAARIDRSLLFPAQIERIASLLRE